LKNPKTEFRAMIATGKWGRNLEKGKVKNKGP
jgi:hypothetical protein